MYNFTGHMGCGTCDSQAEMNAQVNFLIMLALSTYVTTLNSYLKTSLQCITSVQQKYFYKNFHSI